jgi:hypothetical protein
VGFYSSPRLFINHLIPTIRRLGFLSLVGHPERSSTKNLPALLTGSITVYMINAQGGLILYDAGHSKKLA